MELLQLNAVMPLSGGQGGLSVNPITTRRADYALHITASPPGFENPAASLNLHVTLTQHSGRISYQQLAFLSILSC